MEIMEEVEKGLTRVPKVKAIPVSAITTLSETKIAVFCRMGLRGVDSLEVKKFNMLSMNDVCCLECIGPTDFITIMTTFGDAHIRKMDTGEIKIKKFNLPKTPFEISVHDNLAAARAKILSDIGFKGKNGKFPLHPISSKDVCLISSLFRTVKANKLAALIAVSLQKIFMESGANTVAFFSPIVMR